MMTNKSTMKNMTARWMTGFAVLVLSGLTKAADKPAGDGKTLTDKTLVVWASPAALEQGGGSALTMDDLNYSVETTKYTK